MHVTVAPDRATLRAVAADIHARTLNPVLVEPYLPGRKYCVAVCGPVVARDGVLRRCATPLAFSAAERILDDGEAIFTSMDQRAITPERLRLLTEPEGGVGRTLSNLARCIYRDFLLRTLARVDVRADAHGVLNILEANPKPDLRRPDEQGLSLVCAGLKAQGMSYVDFILSLVADRIDSLLDVRTAVGQRLAALAG